MGLEDGPFGNLTAHAEVIQAHATPACRRVQLAPEPPEKRSDDAIEKEPSC